MKGVGSSFMKKVWTAIPVAPRTRMLRATSDQTTAVAWAAKTAAATKVRTARRAVQGTKGVRSIVSSRAFLRLDDPDAQDRRDVAAEAEAHRDEALAVQPHEVHEAVHDEGGPGHVAHVLEKGQGGEEDQQDREKGQDRPDAPDHPVDRAVPGARPAPTARSGSMSAPKPPTSPSRSFWRGKPIL